MRRGIKQVAISLERMPFMAGFMAGALASYRLYQKQKRFKVPVKVLELLRVGWAAGSNSKMDYKAPLILRKAVAFRKMLDIMLQGIEARGLEVLLGKGIPHWYPRFKLLREMPWCSEVGNLTPGYYIVLKWGLNGIYERIKQHPDSPTKEAFVMTIEAIKEFLDHLKSLLASKEFETCQGIAGNQVAQWIKSAPWHPPETFEEALFTVWLLNLLVWYDNHHLIGLGRLDQWLYPYLEHDLKLGRLTEDQAYERIKQFIQWLNNSRFRKSNVLLGDTGQTLVIGGVNSEGRDATNLLSYLFVKAAEELQLPEPKLVARIHRRAPAEFITKIAHLISLNLGYPLICNDEVVIPTLTRAGYELEDARDYSVAACWEYLIPGRSFDQGNMGRVSFLAALLKALDEASEKALSNFDEFWQIFEKHLHASVKERVQAANSMGWIPAPLISIMMEGCVEKCRDITEGGCKYNNYGLLGSSFADAVDSLVVIKKMVFEERVLTLQQLCRLLSSNFTDSETLRQYFLHRMPKFGNDYDEVDVIAVRVADIFADLVKGYKTRYGGYFRPGLGSESGYIYEAQTIGASPNGRKAGEPYAVNLSPALGAPRYGPTAILRSVTKLDLRSMSNCAVVELSMNTSLLPKWKQGENTQAWIEWLIRGFFELGGAEIQFNLIDANLLRDAQQHPERYRDLLIRVWGFSAYFVDLPKEFQDHIIARVEACGL